MIKTKRAKRVVAGILAGVLSITSLPIEFSGISLKSITSYAAGTVTIGNSGTIWKNTGTGMYSNRHYMYIWTGGLNGQNVYCLEPNKRMKTGFTATVNTVSDTGTVNSEYIKLAMAWDAAQVGSNEARYFAVQAMVWGLVQGNSISQIKSEFDTNTVNNYTGSATEAKNQMSNLVAYMTKNEGKTSSNAPINWIIEQVKQASKITYSDFTTPAYQATYNNTKKAFEVKVTLESSNQKLANALKQEIVTPDFHKADGSSYPTGYWTPSTLTYTIPSDDQNEDVSGFAMIAVGATTESQEAAAELGATGLVTIYDTGNSQDQKLISLGVGATITGFSFTPTPIPPIPTKEPIEIDFKVYTYTETFTSSYNIAGEKYDDETEKPLSGVGFDIYERINEASIGSKLERNQISTWTGWKKHASVVTDTAGKFAHSDTLSYHYEKTYCYHPTLEEMGFVLSEEPVTTEGEGDGAVGAALTPDAGGEGGESGGGATETVALTKDGYTPEEAAEINAANQALWQEEYDSCTADFHGYSTKEEARLAMVADRDATWEEFQKIEYDYSVVETTPKDGYILHVNDATHGGEVASSVNNGGTLHNDSIETAVIRTTSSQNGGTYTTLSGMDINKTTNRDNPISLTMSLTDTVSYLLGGSSSVANDVKLSKIRKTNEKTLIPVSTKNLEKIEAQNANTQAIWDYENALIAYESTKKATSSNAKRATISEATGSEADFDMYADEVLEYDLDDSIFSPYIMPTALDPDAGGDAGGDAATATLTITWSYYTDTETAKHDDGAGSTTVLYTWYIYDHRQEGEIHINKRDMELYNADQTGSYAKSQGDATLEGAVYGLYALTDIVHPDGTTGIVYSAGDLVSIATTDSNGDASFMVYTEESNKSLTATNRYNSWIGRPLIIGDGASYVIREMSRSEGYELSVSGSDLKESNKKATGTTTITAAGSAEIGSVFFTPDENDGSFGYASVKYFKTTNGFDVVLTGLPENTTFAKQTQTQQTTTENRPVSYVLVDSTTPLTYEGGEIVVDSSGNPVIATASDGSPLYDTTQTVSKTYSVIKTKGLNFNASTLVPRKADGTQITEGSADWTKWTSTPKENNFIIEVAKAGLLGGGKHKELKTVETGTEKSANLAVVNLTATTTNKEAVEAIWAWFAKPENQIWNSFEIMSVDTNEAIIRYGSYQFKSTTAGVTSYVNDNMFNSTSNTLYVKQTENVTIETTATPSMAQGYVYISYPITMIGSGSYITVEADKKLTSPYQYTTTDGIKTEEKHPYKYLTHTAGEFKKDASGNIIYKKVRQEVLGNVDVTKTITTETPITNVVYDTTNKTYTLHFDNDIADWTGVTEAKEFILKIDIPTETMQDLIAAGIGTSAYATATAISTGSYEKTVSLPYMGKTQVYSDAGTRTTPIIVLERIIKQAIKVEKTVDADSYTVNNTYKDHRDMFTVLFGGFVGSGQKYVTGFHFKAYLVSDLVKAGLLTETETGAVATYDGYVKTESYDYEKLFNDETKRAEFDKYAINWDLAAENEDGDQTTVCANNTDTTSGTPYGTSTLLPYGVYVIVEQIPTELVNKHYDIDTPKEVIVPSVPTVTKNADGSTTVHSDILSSEYNYFQSDWDLTDDSATLGSNIAKYGIRYRQESDVIQAHNSDGDFEVYKYGLDKTKQTTYANTVIAQRYKYSSTSEHYDTANNIYYQRLYNKDGTVADYGVTKTANVAYGKIRSVEGKYAPALVQWSILEPVTNGVIDDAGSIGNRYAGLDADGNYNYVGYALTTFTNTLYSSKLRIEKKDSITGENIIHDGAIFKIYRANRDITSDGVSSVTGTGNVLWKTESVTGTRAELEARGDVDNITWDSVANTYTGTVTSPDYDKLEEVTMIDTTGAKVGIFTAYQTIRDLVIEEEGITKDVNVGYIETYQPLGAGVYVIEEIQAPEGYMKSKPIAVEIYKDKVTYYTNGEKNSQTTAEKYQYATVLGDGSVDYTDTHQIVIEDKPSDMFIHKVEDGDSTVGNENKVATDDKAYGVTPTTSLTNVNDKGDNITYVVYDRKDVLEARGDVTNILYNATKGTYEGHVTKKYDEWSETLIEETEAVAITTSNHKPLYDVTTGAYTGYAMEFGIYVNDASLTLFEALEVTKTGANQYTGIEVIKDTDGKVVSITAGTLATGTHYEISNKLTSTDATTGIISHTTVERSTKAPYYMYWRERLFNNETKSIFFVDVTAINNTKVAQPDGYVGLDVYADPAAIHTETDENGEVWVLNELNQKVFMIDDYGMAYVYDDNGAMLVYVADENNNRVISQSIKVTTDATGSHIYENVGAVMDSAKDPNNTDVDKNLVLYYSSGDVVYENNTWISSNDQPKEIMRMPFGAYIVGEVKSTGWYEKGQIPDGYAQASDQGIVLRVSGEAQHFFIQNEFTKVNISKIDITDKEEVKGATMTLYNANKVADTSQLGYHLEKTTVYTSWISGYEYDDNGNLKLDANGKPIETNEPHWIDHIPYGYYVLEETTVPHNQGYVKSEDVDIYVSPTGDVQSMKMEDDYTATEFTKVDEDGNLVIGAKLSLYKATVDSDGLPMFAESDTIQGANTTIYETVVDTYYITGSKDYLKAKGVTDGNIKWNGTTYEGYITIPLNASSTALSYSPDTLVSEDGSKAIATDKTVLVKAKHSMPVYSESDYLFSYETTDGSTVAATKTTVTSPDGDTYDNYTYDIKYIENLKVTLDSGREITKAFYYTTETGVLRVHYLPIGYYVLTETYKDTDGSIKKGTPEGYATAEPILVYVDEVGRLTMIKDSQTFDGNPQSENSLESYEIRGSYSYIKNTVKANNLELTYLEVDTENASYNAYKDEVKKANSPAAVNRQYIGYVSIPLNATKTSYSVNPYDIKNEDGSPIVKMVNPHIERRTDIYGNVEVVQIFSMTDKPLQVNISKTDVTGAKEVDGARITVSRVNADGSKTVVEQYISGADGVDSNGNLLPHNIKVTEGTYELEETTAPYGFLQSVVVTFEVKDTGEIQYAEMIDEIPDGKLTIVKHDIDDTTKLLENATFTLKNLTTGEVLETLTTKADGKIESTKNYPIGYMDTTGKFVAFKYHIEEIDAPAGYMLSGTHEFEFTYVDGATDIVSYTYDAMNKANQVVISKKILVAEEELEGATLRIDQITLDEKGNKVYTKYTEFVSGKQPTYITGIPDGQYRLVETATPSHGNFVIADDVYFEIKHNMLVPTEVTMYDASSITEIDKIDNYGRLLEGAKLQLLSEDRRTVLYEWTSSAEKGYSIYGLAAGKYYIHEVSTPKGYKRAADQLITVQDVEGVRQIFRFVNTLKTSGGVIPRRTPSGKYITIKKIDYNGNPVAGAEYGLYDMNDNLISSGTTDASGNVKLSYSAAGDYYYKEISAPSGYALNQTPIYITINSYGQVTTGSLVTYDDPARVSIAKVDIEDFSKTLAGAEFTLFDMDSNVIQTAISDEYGIATFSGLTYGEYYIMETLAPHGYEVSPEQRIVTVNKFYTNADSIVWYDSSEGRLKTPQTGDISFDSIKPMIALIEKKRAFKR